MILHLLLIIACAALYRMGGVGKPFNTKYRDWGCPLVYLGYQYFILDWYECPWYLWAVAFLLHFGAMTEYHKWLNRFFGDTREDCHWYNWLMTGLCYGLADLPLALGSWQIEHLITRTIILGLATMVWSEIISDVTAEEAGRGGLYFIL